MLEQQREGIAKAKEEGRYKGRPASIDAYEVRRVARLVGPSAAAKQLSIAALWSNRHQTGRLCS
jgi:DNA invertase Pin-like site-specific DNA recombinase